ncbi:MAG: DUF1874 domain-containing protein [Desulfobacterales bacterium]|nr:DUF1874 domain-containing protein [Desulfobacterales bacterium]
MLTQPSGCVSTTSPASPSGGGSSQCNAFSLSMLDRQAQRTKRSREEDQDPPAGPHPAASGRSSPRYGLPRREEEGADVISAVGHADTAAVFSSLLGRPVPVERRSIKLDEGETALVGQYIGPRLPEGATTLPEGAPHRVVGSVTKLPPVTYPSRGGAAGNINGRCTVRHYI